MPSTAKLGVVRDIVAFERVHRGPSLKLNDEEAAAAAESAIIIWTRGKKGRPLAAEYSFRIKNKK